MVNNCLPKICVFLINETGKSIVKSKTIVFKKFYLIRKDICVCKNRLMNSFFGRLAYAALRLPALPSNAREADALFKITAWHRMVIAWDETLILLVWLPISIRNDS